MEESVWFLRWALPVIAFNSHSKRCCGHSFAGKCGGAHLRLGPSDHSSNSTCVLFLTPQERTSIPFCANRHPLIGWPVPDDPSQVRGRRFGMDSPCKNNKAVTKLSIQIFSVDSDPAWYVHNETIQHIPPNPPENFKLQALGEYFNCH